MRDLEDYYRTIQSQKTNAQHAADDSISVLAETANELLVRLSQAYKRITELERVLEEGK